MSRTVALPRHSEGTKPQRLRPARWLRGDAAAAAAAALTFQGLLTVLGALIERMVSPYQKLSTGAAPPPLSLLQHTYRWDSGYYGAIPDGYYQQDPQAAAFYPLFPLLARVPDILTFGALGHLWAALIVNTLATWVAVLALVKVTRQLVDVRAAWVAVALMLASPAAFFLHAFYSEATFCAIGFSAYHFALRRRWTAMGLCLIPLTACRVTSVLFVGLCFLEFWRSKGWRLGGLLDRRVLWFPASLLGFLTYSTYCRIVLGDALAMFHAYDVGPFWGFMTFNPNIVGTLSVEAQGVVSGFTGGPFPNQLVVDQILPLTGLALLLAASGYLLRVWGRDGIPLAGFGVASFVMFTLNSNTISVHRYLLPCLVLYVAGVVFLGRRPWRRWLLPPVLYASVMLQAVLFAVFTANQWAG